MYELAHNLTRTEKAYIRSIMERRGWLDVRFLADGQIVGRYEFYTNRFQRIADVNDPAFESEYGRYIVYVSGSGEHDEEFGKYFNREEAVLQARHINKRTDDYSFVIDQKTGKKL